MKLGVDRHYKNILVQVVGVASHSETLEEMVVYEKLENHNEFKKGSLWVRPKKIFLETVEKDGKEVKRFEYIGA